MPVEDVRDIIVAGARGGVMGLLLAGRPQRGSPRSVGVSSKIGAEEASGVESGGECGGGLLSA